MPEERKPQWVRFGAGLRKAREIAGVSQAQAARATGWSRSTISALETGFRSPQRSQVEALDHLLATGGALMRLWVSLANNVDAPEWFRDVLALEREASVIREYQSMLVPGLLQTADYARAVIRSGSPWFSPQKVESLVEARVRRHEVLSKTGRPVAWFVADDVAFRRRMGGPAVMRAQLERLLELSGDVIRLQVLRSEPNTHPGLGGPFRIMNFTDRQQVGYAEHTLGGELTSDTREVEELNLMFGAIQGEALSPGASVDFVHAALKGT
ncbi:helix-turn-helix domain-containing protein [Actinorugispora endophytica]|uniref:Transcriptional regulator with XRE-family HTH domain n=1 Tax=Actinorugispora endophytica TaxID=1605990 RepID=A0A4R6UBY0_9ACTN|nr:helix-turn-helix transcriptional regulator [Actinorugispora endophytica]TDQ44180.1 transcriptional regulator with XRE-family HTH domain [Actinorugispora endophytica]